jgi:hypothetical protein
MYSAQALNVCSAASCKGQPDLTSLDPTLLRSMARCKITSEVGPSGLHAAGRSCARKQPETAPPLMAKNVHVTYLTDDMLCRRQPHRRPTYWPGDTSVRRVEDLLFYTKRNGQVLPHNSHSSPNISNQAGNTSSR